jgi:hypothetical protein
VVLGKLDIHIQKNKIRSLPCTKINSKWIKDLNGRPVSLQLLEENVGKILQDKGIQQLSE